MRFNAAIDAFVTDMRGQGRIGSSETERQYRGRLGLLADVVENRDPRKVGRTDIKRFLSRWTHPNTQRNARSIAISFFDWMVEEGLRDSNPARATRRPRTRPAQVYRLTSGETVAMLRSAKTVRERRCLYLGFCAGLRNKELRGLQGRHFARAGWVRVSGDIAKGGKERWIPVIEELAEVVAEIRAQVAMDDYVLPAQRFRDPRRHRLMQEYLKTPCSSQAIVNLVRRVAHRAGLPGAEIHPHLMRHSWGEHVARYAGVRVAQAVLGHADLGTTEGYLGRPSMGEISGGLAGFRFDTRPTVGLSAVSGPVRAAAEEFEVNPCLDPSPSYSGFGAVLRALWGSEALRGAARGMAS